MKIGKGYYTGRKFTLHFSIMLWDLRHNTLYIIGDLVKNELLSMNSELVYNIHDKTGKIITKMPHLLIQERFKKGIYEVAW